MVRACRAMAIAVRTLLSLPNEICSWDQVPSVLHPSDVQRDQQSFLDLEHHVDQLFLGELERRDRLAELPAVQRVGQCCLVSVASRVQAPQIIP